MGSIPAHDNRLVEEWNRRVGPQDRVYHLGDFALCHPYKAKEIRKKLNGDIYLIRGNHEKTAERIKDEFVWIKDVFYLKMPDGQRLWLSHYAHRVWLGSHKGVWHLHGHSHGSLCDDPHAYSLDMAVDVWGWGPVSYEEVRKRMAKKLEWRPVDHHDGKRLRDKKEERTALRQGGEGTN